MKYPKSERYLPTQTITSSSLLHPKIDPFIIMLCPYSQLLSYSSSCIQQQGFKGPEYCTGVTEIMTILAHKEKANKWISLLRSRNIYALIFDPNNNAFCGISIFTKYL